MNSWAGETKSLALASTGRRRLVSEARFLSAAEEKLEVLGERRGSERARLQ